MNCPCNIWNSKFSNIILFKLFILEMRKLSPEKKLDTLPKVLQQGGGKEGGDLRPLTPRSYYTWQPSTHLLCYLVPNKSFQCWVYPLLPNK